MCFAIGLHYSAIHKTAGSLVTGCSQNAAAGMPPEAIPPFMASGTFFQ